MTTHRAAALFFVSSFVVMALTLSSHEAQARSKDEGICWDMRCRVEMADFGCTENFHTSCSGTQECVTSACP
jgi:hypothetical protein